MFAGETGPVFDTEDVVQIGNGKAEWTVTSEWMTNDDRGKVLVHVRAVSGQTRRVPMDRLTLVREGSVAIGNAETEAYAENERRADVDPVVCAACGVRWGTVGESLGHGCSQMAPGADDVIEAVKSTFEVKRLSHRLAVVIDIGSGERAWRGSPRTAPAMAKILNAMAQVSA